MEEWQTISELEGLTVEEAKLSYAERKDLPSTAFCGPDKSYPAYDARHVRNALARLHFVKSPAIRAKIMACLRRRAKKFGIDVSESDITGEKQDNAQTDATIQWYLHSLGIE